MSLSHVLGRPQISVSWKHSFLQGDPFARRGSSTPPRLEQVSLAESIDRLAYDLYGLMHAEVSIEERE